MFRTQKQRRVVNIPAAAQHDRDPLKSAAIIDIGIFHPHKTCLLFFVTHEHIVSDLQKPLTVRGGVIKDIPGRIEIIEHLAVRSAGFPDRHIERASRSAPPVLILTVQKDPAPSGCSVFIRFCLHDRLDPNRSEFLRPEAYCLRIALDVERLTAFERADIQPVGIDSQFMDLPVPDRINLLFLVMLFICTEFPAP